MCEKNAEWKWVGDEDSLSVACLWLQCLHSFGSHSQDGKFPSSDLPHSWVAWNNWWLQSNQMPVHQHLPLCSVATVRSSVDQASAGSLSVCVWLLSWQSLLEQVCKLRNLHLWLSASGRPLANATVLSVNMARIKTADFPFNMWTLVRSDWVFHFLKEVVRQKKNMLQNHFLRKDPFCLMCKRSKDSHVTPS